MAENKMVRWHHGLNGHEFEQTPEIVKDRGVWRAAVQGSQRDGHNLPTELQQGRAYNLKLSGIK